MSTIRIALSIILISFSTSVTVAQIQWTKYPGNPILSPAQINPGSCEFSYFKTSTPTVLFENGLFRMWYAAEGFAPNRMYSMGYAQSENGVDWFHFDKNPVLRPGSTFDDTYILGGTVLKDGTQYKMYYGAFSSAAQQWTVGLATSPDRVHWTKLLNPVLIGGGTGSWDENGVNSPCVTKEGEGQYKMWFSGISISTTSIGYATSTDGITWVKYSGNPILAAAAANPWESSLVADPRVVKVGFTYHLFYMGAPGPSANQIGYASSGDGIHWSRYSGNPVLRLGASGSWDDYTLSTHWVIWQDTTFKMWYAGQTSGGAVQLGYATCPLMQASVNIPLATGWNMISNPVTATDDTVLHLFPTSEFTYAYYFTPGGYVMDTTMRNGVGYWGMFPAWRIQSLTGFPRLRDSISVSAGWNMMGTISSSVDTGAVISLPAGLRGSSWYGYGTAGYSPVTQLIAGQAYWVNATVAGKFVLASTLLARSGGVQASTMNPADVLNMLTVADSKGRSQTLYFGEDAENNFPASAYAMPPVPPVGAFDARFSAEGGSASGGETGSMVRTHAAKVSGSIEFPVRVQSDAYPLTVTWDVSKGASSYEMTDGNGGRVFPRKEMAGVDSVRITSSGLNRFSVRLAGIRQLPKEFALAQNYPNPFNPSTTIKYDLPVDSHVALSIFNIVGQDVVTLVNEEQKAGYKSVKFDAGNLASGTYFYRLQAGTFTSVKKLLLLK